MRRDAKLALIVTMLIAVVGVLALRIGELQETSVEFDDVRRDFESDVSSRSASTPIAVDDLRRSEAVRDVVRRWFSSTHNVEALRGREAILLGDGVHCSHEFHVYRSEFFRECVHRLGVRTLAIEAGISEVDRMQEFVGSDDISIVECFRPMSAWIWKSKEMADDLRWIRRWNREHPRDVICVVGIDAQFADWSIDRLEHLFPEVGVGRRLVGLRDLYWHERTVILDGPRRSEVDRAVTEIRTVLERREVSLTAEARRHLRVLDLQRRIVTQPSWRTNRNERDRVMAEEVVRHVRARPGPVVAWAHDGHVQREPSGERVTIGSEVTRLLGFDAVFVALSFFLEGDITVADYEDLIGLDTRRGRLLTESLEPSKGKLDFMLWTAIGDLGFAFPGDFGAAARELRTSRWIGSVARRVYSLRSIRLVDSADLVFFVKRLTGMRRHTEMGYWFRGQQREGRPR